MRTAHSAEGHRTLHAVRVGGVLFLIAVSLVFFFGLGGTHTHGELFVGGSAGEVRVPGSKAEATGGEVIVSAGALTFRLENASSVDHEFAVFAKSAEGEALAGLAAVGTNPTGGAVTLSPGTYRIVCATRGHESEGMSYQLRVE